MLLDNKIYLFLINLLRTFFKSNKRESPPVEKANECVEDVTPTEEETAQQAQQSHTPHPEAKFLVPDWGIWSTLA
jgi:hypothetical protein